MTDIREPDRKPTGDVRLSSDAGQKLVADLQRIKRDCGLSFTQLQSRLPYSRAALERYINGKHFPPQQEIVADIARVCGVDAEPLLKFWRAAAAAEPPPPPRRFRPRLLVGLAAAVVLLVGGTIALLSFPRQPPQGCRSFDADIHTYTAGQLCWGNGQVHARGYLHNDQGPSPARADLCISNRPGVCAQQIELATAKAGETQPYDWAVTLPNGYGAWIHACSGNLCSNWL